MISKISSESFICIWFRPVLMMFFLGAVFGQSLNAYIAATQLPPLPSGVWCPPLPPPPTGRCRTGLGDGCGPSCPHRRGTGPSYCSTATCTAGTPRQFHSILFGPLSRISQLDKRRGTYSTSCLCVLDADWHACDPMLRPIPPTMCSAPPSGLGPSRTLRSISPTRS